MGLSGELVTEEILGEGPAVMVFWKRPHFLSEAILEDLKAYHDRFGEELRIYAVHTGDRGPAEGALEEIMAYAESRQIPFPVLLDWNGRARRSYRITAVPSAVVFSSEGRSTFNLEGYARRGRRELAENLHEVMGRDRETGNLVALPGGKRGSDPSGRNPPALCRVPRSLYCLFSAEQGGASSDPAVMAVRLAACRGDMEQARKMIRGIGREELTRNDLRFALGNMMLLKGRTAEAEEVFKSLLARAPGEGWGFWGLGMSALAAGRAAEAARHMRRASVIDGGNAEAETAVLRFMEEYWKKNRAAPGERAFLSLFATLSSVRDCYRQVSRGS